MLKYTDFVNTHVRMHAHKSLWFKFNL